MHRSNADLCFAGAAEQAREIRGKGMLHAFSTAGRIIAHYGPWNVIGQPAITVPVGFDALGLPTSVHLAGRADDEATLLALAAQLEAAEPWAHKRPVL